MCITINTIKSYTDLWDCMAAGEIWMATLDDKHISMLTQLVMQSLPSTKAEGEKDQQPY